MEVFEEKIVGLFCSLRVFLGKVDEVRSVRDDVTNYSGYNYT